MVVFMDNNKFIKVPSITLDKYIWLMLLITIIMIIIIIIIELLIAVNC